MNQRQKAAHTAALKHRIQFPTGKMDLGVGLMEHMRLLPGEKCRFEDAEDFIGEVNEELSIIDGERSSYEQPEQPNHLRNHRSNHRV